MKQNSDKNGPPDSGAGQSARNDKSEESKSSSPNGSRVHSNGHSAPQKLDFWVAMDILANRWHWLAVGGILLAGAFFYLGSNLIKEKFTASGQLRRNETPEFLKSTATSRKRLPRSSVHRICFAGSARQPIHPFRGPI